MNYSFKSIKAIATAKDMINIVLSKTQRKTPTVVHPGYEISRIRGFYMRKIKFCEETINQRLTDILETFPKVEDIHPFYGDLINVLYDKDHYKLALGHIKASKNMCQNLCKDYLKLVKYADSLYRCKSLKKAALGRMCTIIKKISSSLAYLEEVRKHLARLPSINPFERTILVTGYPNVGKSSFVNSVTKANVDVQPYPFTTQSLYVGHTEYKNLRFQVIDSPGILDHPLEEMNTIEMQSVTALAHLKSCILYFVDLSEQCGYNLAEQIHLYENIKPLFKNKPVLIVFNKTDVKKLEDLTPAQASTVHEWLTVNNFKYVSMSALERDGTDNVKEQACELIMDVRSQQSVDSLAGGSKVIKHEESFLRGIYIAQPKPRDNKERPAVQAPARAMRAEKPTIKEIEEQNGGAGVFNFPIQEQYILPEEWKYDEPPEFFNGKNVADFVDPDIWERLGELEREEEAIASMQAMKIEEEDDHGITAEKKAAFEEIEMKRHAFRTQHKLKKNKTAYPTNKDFNDLKEVLEERGVETDALEDRLRSESVARKNKRELSRGRSRAGDMDEEEQPGERLAGKLREKSRSRSKGFQREVTALEKKVVVEKNKRSKQWRYEGKYSESDRHIPVAMPRHLYSGKTDKGSRDRR